MAMGQRHSYQQHRPPRRWIRNGLVTTPTWTPGTVTTLTDVCEKDGMYPPGDGSTGNGGGGPNRVIMTVPYAPTVTPNLTSGVDLLLIIGAMTGNMTIANPTGSFIDGQRMVIRVRQDGVGGRVVTLDTQYRIPGSATSPLAWSTAPNDMDILAAIWNLADTKWDVVSLVPGY